MVPPKDWKLELIIVPVSDVDRAKAFYRDIMGFHVDVDHAAGEDFRIVQLTPPGSACSITLMRMAPAGVIRGLHLVVPDVGTAREMLVGSGADVGQPYHWVDGSQVPGSDPARGDHNTFLDIVDPDGNGWVLQEVPSRAS